MPGTLPGLAASACKGQLAGGADKVHVLADVLLPAPMRPSAKHIMTAVSPKPSLGGPLDSLLLSVPRSTHCHQRQVLLPKDMG